MDKNKYNIVKNKYDIIKTDNGYELQNAFKEVDGKFIRVHKEERKDQLLNKCMYCYNSYYKQKGFMNDSCHCYVFDELYETEQMTIECSRVIEYCEAFDEAFKLNIISSMDDMVSFINKSETMFNCTEDFEMYWGFERNWNEDTGDILETTEEYYKRGGEFENIPDEFPCAIYFDWEKEHYDLVFDKKYDSLPISNK